MFFAVNVNVYIPFTAILASCSTDGKCILWDASSGQPLASLSHPSGSSIRTCRFSPSDDMIATGADDNKIALWNVATRQLIKYVGVMFAHYLCVKTYYSVSC